MTDPLLAIGATVGGYAAVESAFYLLLRELKKSCPWIIFPGDLDPKIDTAGLEKFIQHGWDPELGWIRKPNTAHDEVQDSGKRTSYQIDEHGNRRNPGFGQADPVALAYGDSYTFGRLVNDDETWAHFLSHRLGRPVHNRGVGNYGMDQAQLRLEREFDDMPAPILIMGVVPETISRIHSVWKHLSEYGNHFGFKPRFEIAGDGLTLHPNPIRAEADFLDIARLLPELKRHDPFFDWRFSKDIIRAPALLSLLATRSRNLSLIAAALRDRLAGGGTRAFSVVMERNIEFCRWLYGNPAAVDLLIAISERFERFAEARRVVPVIVVLPQLFDLRLIQKHGHFYQTYLERIRDRVVAVDVTPYFLAAPDFHKLYINDKYGGHLSVEGNRRVAEILAEAMRADPRAAAALKGWGPSPGSAAMARAERTD